MMGKGEMETNFKAGEAVRLIKKGWQASAVVIGPYARDARKTRIRFATGGTAVVFNSLLRRSEP